MIFYAFYYNKISNLLVDPLEVIIKSNKYKIKEITLLYLRNLNIITLCVTFMIISYIYIYIYIYIYTHTNFVEYNRHFLSTYFLVDPFILLYWFYIIRRELIGISSIIVYFPSTFRPTFGHHQERMYYKSDEIHPPLMMAQSRAESTWEINNFGRYINQFPLNTIKSIQQYERINKKICRPKMSIIFNKICINEEMLPIYIYIYWERELWVVQWLSSKKMGL